MPSDDYLKKFSTAIILASRLSGAISDPFAAGKLEWAVAALIAAHAESLAGKAGDAERHVLDRLAAIREAVDWCERFNLAPHPDLLHTRRALLDLQVSVRRPSVSSDVSSAPSGAVQKSRHVSGRPLPENQDKILGFIKQFPSVRVRDIADGFGTLSERTVQRSLKGLLKGGFVRKRLQDKTVYYAASDKN